jgi:hypothetical protein
MVRIGWAVHILAGGLKGNTNLVAVHLGASIFDKALILLFFILKSDIIKEAKVLKEIVFTSVLSEHFKDTNHLVVPLINKLVKVWNGLKVDHT